MPTCRHNFHLSCIDTWLQKQTTCPICRISLELPGAKAADSPARSPPRLLSHPESSVSRSPHWILPIHRDRTGGRDRPASQESLEVVIELQPETRQGITMPLRWDWNVPSGASRTMCRNHVHPSCSTVLLGFGNRVARNLFASLVLRHALYITGCRLARVPPILPLRGSLNVILLMCNCCILSQETVI
jgi:hypothetical protein